MKDTSRLRLTHAVGLAVVLMAASPALSRQRGEAETCQPVSPDLATRLERFTQLRFRLQSMPSLEILEKRPDCYYKLAFTEFDGPNRFRKTVYLTPDRKHLSLDVVDVDGDPDTNIRNEENRAKSTVETGAQLIHGSERAPVQLVVYADFQCQ